MPPSSDYRPRSAMPYTLPTLLTEIRIRAQLSDGIGRTIETSEKRTAFCVRNNSHTRIRPPKQLSYAYDVVVTPFLFGGGSLPPNLRGSFSPISNAPEGCRKVCTHQHHKLRVKRDNAIDVAATDAIWIWTDPKTRTQTTRG